VLFRLNDVTFDGCPAEKFNSFDAVQTLLEDVAIFAKAHPIFK